MNHSDKTMDTRPDSGKFLTKIIHRMRDDLAQLDDYQRVGILPDLICLEILERILLNLTFYLRKKFPKQKEKEPIVNLTRSHKDVLRRVEHGADIWGYPEARLLRECEKDGLVEICEPVADPPGAQRQPYFGCIITAKGKAALRL